MILLTGATGNVGTELARILRARAVPFRAMVRSPEAARKTEALAGAELVAGDFNDPAAIARALTGIERALLLTPSSEQAEAQQSVFVDVARREGLRHVVKLSQEDGHEGRTYDITGPEALTHAEMAERFSDAVGRRIEFVDVPPDAMREALIGAGFPAWQADGLLEDYAHYRRGEAAAVASGVQDATDKAPRTFADFARDYAAAFS